MAVEGRMFYPNTVMQHYHDSLHNFLVHKRKPLRNFVLLLCIVLYSTYFGYAMYHSVDDNVALIVLTSLFLAFIAFQFVRRVYGEQLSSVYDGVVDTVTQRVRPRHVRIAWFAVLGAAALIYVAVDARYRPYRLVSLSGIAVFVLIGFITSTRRTKIPWRMFFAGLFLQFLLGLITLRWQEGSTAFQFLGEQVSTFLGYADVGSNTVFSQRYGLGNETYMDHPFAFQSMTIVLYFSAFIRVCYYLGILQYCIMAIGRVIEFVMGIHPVLAFVGAANIFLGPDTSALTIKPFLVDMTRSGYHSVLTSGFSTIAGASFAMYIGFGIDARHLLIASVMSAPAALAVGKMLYPEVEIPKANKGEKTVIKFAPPKERNIVEAFCSGAREGGFIAVSVIINLIAFMALLNFANATMAWFAALVRIQNLTLISIFGYLFLPVAFLMGVDPQDCAKVGELLGVKIFLTEIVAYEQLGVLMENRKKNILPALTRRSEIISTYALCGFATFGDIGICIGAIGSMVPKHRKGDLTDVALRAMLAGNIACFLTACIAGLMITD